MSSSWINARRKRWGQTKSKSEVEADAEIYDQFHVGILPFLTSSSAIGVVFEVI